MRASAGARTVERVSSDADLAGRAETGFLSRPPPPALRPYVRWVVAYDVDMGAPGVHLGLPSTALTLVFPVDEPLDVGWAAQPATRVRRTSLASGLHTLPAEIHHSGWQTGVQVALTTAGAPALLGVPAAALAGELVGLPELAGPRSSDGLCHLPEQLHDTADLWERIRLVERALTAALARGGRTGPRAEVGRALSSLTRGAQVSEVADDVGWSRRHLTAQVRAECGLAPKEFQRVARFERSHILLRRAARAGRVHVADLAAATGYADQSHLTREWVNLGACTPREWLRTEFPFLQDQPDEIRHAGVDGAPH